MVVICKRENIDCYISILFLYIIYSSYIFLDIKFFLRRIVFGIRKYMEVLPIANISATTDIQVKLFHADPRISGRQPVPLLHPRPA